VSTHFRLQDFHPLRCPFPWASTNMLTSTAQSYNPHGHARGFGLFRVRSPLLAESLLVFFSSTYLDVSVRWVRDYCLHVFNVKGCPIRTPTDLRSFAPPRRFSQLTTSFVASESQGIPRAPLVRFQILIECPKAFNNCSSASACLNVSTNTHILYDPCGSLFSTSHSLLLLCIPSLVNELFLVEDIGFEPMTPSLQS
jgi:hypothetical protein